MLFRSRSNPRKDYHRNLEVELMDLGTREHSKAVDHRGMGVVSVPMLVVTDAHVEV